MDDFQIAIAEKIFEKAKETGGLPDLMFAQFILTTDQQKMILGESKMSK